MKSKLGVCEREMVGEEGIATDTFVCITYFGVLYVIQHSCSCDDWCWS